MIREGNVLLNVFIEKCVLNYVILQAVLSRYFTLSKALFFCLSQNLQKCGKSVTLLICISHFVRFKKFFIENITGYNICIY